MPAELPPLLARTARALETVKPDREGFISTHGAGLVSIRISPSQTKRAIAIAVALIEAAEQRGYQPASAKGGLALTVDGEPLELSVQERPEQVPHVPTAAELKEKERREKSGYSWYRGDPWKKYDYRPSGRLAIQIVAEPYSGIRLRRSWGDHKHKRVEYLLNDVFAGLAAYSAAKRVKRLEREEREREWREAEERRQREARRKALNADRLKLLDVIGDTLKEQGRLQRLIAELERRWNDVADERIAMFLKWAREYASELDQNISVERIANSVDYYRLFPNDVD